MILGASNDFASRVWTLNDQRLRVSCACLCLLVLLPPGHYYVNCCLETPGIVTGFVYALILTNVLSMLTKAKIVINGKL